MVHVDEKGIFLSGMRTEALLHLNYRMAVSEVCTLPAGVHNARRWRDNILFNDTASDFVRNVRSDGRQQAFRIWRYDESEIERRHRRFEDRTPGIRPRAVHGR